VFVSNKILTIGLVAAVLIVAGAMLAMGKKSAPGISGGSSSSVQELYAQAVALEEKNELLKARENYQKIMSDYPDFKEIANVQKKLESANLKIIFSAIETPQTIIHEVQPGESLGKIAKQYSVTTELIKKSNNLTQDTIKAGQRLRIWKGVFSIFVDKSQNILLLKCDGEIIKVYNVSTGKNNITPVGTFKIVNKLIDPPWYKNGRAIPPGNPENILGSRWMGFDIPSYGIHGTTQPETIGQQVTAGCVRMRNEEVEELFSLIPVGTQVTIID